MTKIQRAIAFVFAVIMGSVTFHLILSEMKRPKSIAEMNGVTRFETEEAICYKYHAGFGRGLSCKWKE